MVFGKGINDLSSKVPSYGTWHSTIRRSYSERFHQDNPAYRGTKVAEDWLLLSNFDKWYNSNYKYEGWQLDKDLLEPTLKTYSKDTCVFLPSVLNMAIQERSNSKENKLPPGVYFKKANGKYCSQLAIDTEQGRSTQHLILHDDPMLCFKVYQEAKSEYVQKLTKQFKAGLDPRAYEKLMKYRVEYSA